MNEANQNSQNHDRIRQNDPSPNAPMIDPGNIGNSPGAHAAFVDKFLMTTWLLEKQRAPATISLFVLVELVAAPLMILFGFLDSIIVPTLGSLMSAGTYVGSAVLIVAGCSAGGEMAKKMAQLVFQLVLFGAMLLALYAGLGGKDAIDQSISQGIPTVFFLAVGIPAIFITVNTIRLESRSMVRAPFINITLKTLFKISMTGISTTALAALVLWGLIIFSRNSS